MQKLLLSLLLLTLAQNAKANAEKKGLDTDNLVIVQTGDAVLICPRDRAGEVRELVERLEAEGLEEHL